MLFIEQDNECGDCPDFWQWVEKDNRCVDRCKGGKSFNRYLNDEYECLDLYDVFDDVADTNELLLSHKESSTLGGSLSERLDCGLDTIDIPTPFSERSFDLTGYQYLEFITSLDP